MVAGSSIPVAATLPENKINEIINFFVMIRDDFSYE